MNCLRVRRRRSGARCWLDQELVRRFGMTDYRPAAAVSRAQTGTAGPDEQKPEDQSDALMLADELDFVVGVDTHLDEHVLAVVAAATGAVLAGQVVRANERGYQAALRFAGAAAGGCWRLGGRGHG
jgi:hypothetical protein